MSAHSFTVPTLLRHRRYRSNGGEADVTAIEVERYAVALQEQVSKCPEQASSGFLSEKDLAVPVGRLAVLKDSI